jgi:hypothetical protein
VLGIVAAAVWDFFLKRPHGSACPASYPPASQEEKHG